MPGLTHNSIKRIGDRLRRIPVSEREQRELPPAPGHAPFQARLTGLSDGMWSWKRVIYKHSQADPFVDWTGAVGATGTDNARQIGEGWAEVGDVVTMWLLGSDTDSGPQGSVVLGFYAPRRLAYGKLKADWTDSQSQVSIDPCDAAGNDNGLADVDVYVQNDKTAFDPSTATVAGSGIDIGTKVAADTIIPYAIDEDGDWIVPAQPHQVIVDSRVYAAEDELQAKVAWSWGWFTTTTSAWLDVGDVFAEDAFTVLTDNADQTAGYLDDEIEVGEAAGQAHTWLGKSVDDTANDHKLRLYLDGPGPVEHTVTLGDGTIIEWDAKGLIVSVKGVST